jgi:hypothetical protein
MSAIVKINQPESPAQILAAALKLAPNYSTHALTLSETSTAPFVFDEESGVCLDAAGNLCISMIVKNTDISIYFKTAAHGEIEVPSQDVTPALEPYNDRYYDTSYNAHTVEKDALCCVIQAESVFVSEGAIFRLTEQQAHRINEALAAHSVDNTPTIHHA